MAHSAVEAVWSLFDLAQTVTCLGIYGKAILALDALPLPVFLLIAD